MSGEQARESVAAALPDIVLLDLGLPGIDGWETARRLRAMTAAAGLPIITLTAHALEDDREHALDAGCGAFDTKQIVFTRMQAKMEALR